MSAAAIEFRASEDDAWYDVRLSLEEEGEILRVKFENFAEDCFDERFRPDFKDSEALQEFSDRFRLSSDQVQDGNCRLVEEGKLFCVSLEIGPNDLKFYDAVVDKVCSSKHTFEKDKYVCTCSFDVFWKHGPYARLKTRTGIANICLIRSGSAQLDQALDSFLKLSRVKLNKDKSGISEPKGAACYNVTNGSNFKSKPYRRKSSKCNFKGAKHHKQADMVQKTIGMHSNGLNISGQDCDLGGDCFRVKHLEAASSCLYILIENLDTDISPSEIVNFIYQETSILCKAFVLPGLLSEAYTRGVIFVLNQEKLETLSRFLHSPDQLIMSSRGRPWVITQKGWRLGTHASMLLKYEVNLQNKIDLEGKIKVVTERTKEYENGKRLRDLFLEFHEHLQHLHKRLALEEQNVLQSHCRL